MRRRRIIGQRVGLGVRQHVPGAAEVLEVVARLVFGRTAMFWVTPVMGGIAVFLAFVLGSRLAGKLAGLLAALLTASSPVFLYQIV